MEKLKTGHVWVTGLPGAGKTWMYEHVRDRVKGADTDDSILRWGRGREPIPKGASAWWVLTHRPNWDHNELRELLRTNEDFMVFGAPGGWHDIFRAFPKFPRIYYLYENISLMRKRFEIERENQFGTSLAERVYSYVAAVPMNIVAKITAKVNKKFIILDASLPTEELFSQIMRN